ncbi:metal-sensitive transcriptional regulator [Bifidobacterium simiarum]|uniref:Transcriptional regulator n=1 Tax=Bifidobacterium simiarum TaxID=2045441 RepID=A0A2M9HDL6_9BIFI|nr:metal-sensitive transcriptional regulator [Bifidobacterium simiarum]PJM74905.1 transcriptional regulator [Bifidobacterium simiarum]
MTNATCEHCDVHEPHEAHEVHEIHETHDQQGDRDQHRECDQHAAGGYIEDQKRIIARLSRIEGQIRGIKQMAQDGEYCIDILTQISAANSALKSVALILLDDHLNHCVRQAAAEGGDVADDKLDEASAAIARLVRS